MRTAVPAVRTWPWPALALVLLAVPWPAGAQDAVTGVAAASRLWQPLPPDAPPPPAARRIAPGRYRTLALDPAELGDVLARAPREATDEVGRASAAILELPWPDGTFRRFRIEESPVMEPALAAQFPDIKTYRGDGLDVAATARFDWTPAGFHALVLSAEGTIYVDPYDQGPGRGYVVYDRRFYRREGAEPFRCGVTGEDLSARAEEELAIAPAQIPNGAILRTYRAAVAATGEYTAFFGGTVPAAMNAIVTTVNRINTIYERDLAVRLVLVAGNASLVYTNPATDPYTDGNDLQLLCQNTTNVDNVIGAANYDIGHVFGRLGGGLALVGSVCNSTAPSASICGSGAGSRKAAGTTSAPVPQGDPFDVDYVAHEMGHQFGGFHTFNGTTLSCGGGSRDASTAFEPGSGSTIMAYAGICGAEDLQPNSDAYFHAGSQDQLVSFVNASVCPATSPTGNLPPTVDAGPNYTVPSQTPFTLAATGSDLNGDVLTYAWEEMDLGTASPPHDDNGTRPRFRSFLPSTSPSRTFPRLSDILGNVTTFGERLPTTTRAMSFRVTARDNRAGGGGTASDDMVLSVRADSGPFAVTAPNSALIWAAGSSQTVTWNPANTAAAPVSCANVKVSLSTDGGNTFPIVLAASTPNDGSQSVAVPGAATATARIKVEAVGNVFFDVSNANFTISASDLIFEDGFQ